MSQLLMFRRWARAISHGSFKRLQADDYVMMVTFVSIIGITIVASDV